MVMFDCYVGMRVLITGDVWTFESGKKSLANPLKIPDAQIYQHMDEKK
jgi:hypothetical protein